MEEEVFVDAEEEVTPRRTGRKRRSTAGSVSASVVGKKSRQAGKMPLERSPKVSSPKPPVPKGTDLDAFWGKMGGMLGGLESRLKLETEDVKNQLGRAIGDLGSRIDKTEKRMDGIIEEVNMIIDKRIAAYPAVTESVGPDPDPAGPSGSEEPSKRSYAIAAQSPAAMAMQKILSAKPRRRAEDDYWESRRALRLRPIVGTDSVRAVHDFMVDHLKLGETFMQCLGPIQVVRVPCGPAAKVKDEAVVTFQSVDTRDAVRSAARNLAGKSSDYGVRLEIPNHLKTAMRDLQSASFEIKQRFPSSRRNVLMDDEALDLALDFCTTEGGAWRRMSSGQAKARRMKRASKPSAEKFRLEEGELDGLLGDE